MLVLAPAVCCLSGVAISDILSTLTASLKAGLQPLLLGRRTAAATAPADAPDADGADGGEVVVSKPGRGTPAAKGSKKRVSTSTGGVSSSASGEDGLSNVFGVLSDKWEALPAPVAGLGLVFMLGLMMLYTIHCVGVSADMYSAPSIVLQVSRRSGLGESVCFGGGGVRQVNRRGEWEGSLCLCLWGCSSSTASCLCD